MGTESGGTGGRIPPVEESAGDVPPKLRYFRNFFLDTYFFCISIVYKIKWSKSEEKLTFGGRWVWVPMNPSPNENFMAAPLHSTSQSPTQYPSLFSHPFPSPSPYPSSPPCSSPSPSPGHRLRLGRHPRGQSPLRPPSPSPCLPRRVAPHHVLTPTGDWHCFHPSDSQLCAIVLGFGCRMLVAVMHNFLSLAARG